MLYVLTAVLCLSFGYVLAYPTGAPLESCGIFSANHSVHLPQNSAAPYDIIFDKTSVSPGSIVKVTIQGKNGKQFKGFLIQGRAGQTPVGQFISPNQDSQTLDCSSKGSADAATHVDRNDKDSVTLQWRAPNSQMNVKFRAVVVKNYETYWDKFQSETLTIA